MPAMWVKIAKEFPSLNVTVQAGNTDGLSGLTANIMGQQLPTLFNIEVKNILDINVWVYIVGDNNGNYATDMVSVTNMVNKANLYLRHAGIKLVIAGFQNINNSTWYNVVYQNGVFSQTLDDFDNLHNPKNGLKIIFVNSINGGNVTGFNRTKCMVISKIAIDTTLAHEVGHACDWRDIYIDEGGLNINNVGLVKDNLNYLDSKDRTAGFYDENLLHIELVKRLLMYGVKDANKGYIPHGSVWGVHRLVPGGPLRIEMAPIGLNKPNFINQPFHPN